MDQLKWGSALMALLVSSSVNALSLPSHLHLKPYVGADAQLRRMNFREGFGDNLFHHKAPQGNLYAGFKVSPFLGLEVGFESTTSRMRSSTLLAGEVAAGSVVPVGSSPVAFRSKARVKGPHADVVGYYDLSQDNTWQLLGSVGGSYLKGTYERRTLSVAGMPSSTRRTLSDHKLLLRMGAGFQYKMSDHFNVRATFGWTNTSKMAIYANDRLMPMAPTPEVKPKNSTVYALGGQWAF